VLRELRCLSDGTRLRILDLGCGNGYVTAQISALGHEVIGVDQSRDGVDIARAAHPGIRFETASLYEPRLEGMLSGPTDCVVALEVIEHLFLPARLFEASRRVLVPGGWLVVSTPYHGYLKNLAISLVNGWDRHFGASDDGGHIKFFSRRTLTSMAESHGFRVVRVHGAGRVRGLWKSILLVAKKVG
jgi:2-polyprenyl-3-methyl-5-hydroxy-6-metoxy-1,4-benzoquinol methylase